MSKRRRRVWGWQKGPGKACWLPNVSLPVPYIIEPGIQGRKSRDGQLSLLFLKVCF